MRRRKEDEARDLIVNASLSIYYLLRKAHREGVIDDRLYGKCNAQLNRIHKGGRIINWRCLFQEDMRLKAKRARYVLRTKTLRWLRARFKGRT